MFWTGTGSTTFQSTLPGWGATRLSLLRAALCLNFNPRSPDGERLGHGWNMLPGSSISIHAPRMGSDASVRLPVCRIHAFQSTLPGWGATAKMDIFAHDMGKIIHFQH